MRHFFRLMLCCVLTVPVSAHAERWDSTGAGISPSADYEVTVDGKTVPVYASPIPAAFCSFDWHGAVVVRIKAKRDIKWVDVRPLVERIVPVFNDSLIILRLDHPMMLSVELNGSRNLPLFLFANKPEINLPARNDPDVIRFDSARVYHPGVVRVKSNQTVYIAAGAVVQGVILADHARHIRICGRGILDGTANNDFVSDEGRGYRRSIECCDCVDVTIEGVTLYNSTSWEIVPIHCDSVQIRGVRILSDHDSDDGIDVVRSTHVDIGDCFIRTKDDCIAIKSNMEYAATEGVSNVRVHDCVLWNGVWGNALEIGFELNSNHVSHIVFDNIDLIHVQDGAAISIHNAGKAVVEDVRYLNIRIEDATQKLFDLAIFRSRYSEDAAADQEEERRLYLHGAWDGVLRVLPGDSLVHGAYRGIIRNITFRNIRVVDGLFPYSIFCGYDRQHRVEQVGIEGLIVHGRRLRTASQAHIYRRQVVDLWME